MRKLLLGDEAIAQGALDAGLSGVYAYPGTPSTEITEFIQHSPLARERGVHSRWSSNEKTAMEAALGMSFMGKRAMVCMKHVGLNVCADPFVNSAMTGVNGGLVVLVADDPSMHSSQDEQDSRFYGKFAMLPTFEPSSQQEAYDMMAVAFDYSEKQKLPVLMRVTTRMAHSRAVVDVKGEARPENELNYNAEASSWVLLPANARRRNDQVTAQQLVLEEDAEKSAYNSLSLTPNTQHPLGIIASGIAYNYVMEALGNSDAGLPILKISQYPLPKKLVRKMLETCEKVLIAEEGQPFIEDIVRGVSPIDGKLLSTDCQVFGRLDGTLPRTGELTPDVVKKALVPIVNCQLSINNGFAPSENVVPRPPALCQGCGHRDVYTALNEVLKEYDNPRVFGDIGCYTLGFLPPYKAIHSCVDMGASITMA
ncbi:MAG: indolepyruvate ferredoxin oxidoreductase, partial [Prevotella sp.]|nr:indolepyruvate ferredoxin oxidoreductase [Prevotella sp.]